MLRMDRHISKELRLARVEEVLNEVQLEGVIQAIKFFGGTNKIISQQIILNEPYIVFKEATQQLSIEDGGTSKVFFFFASVIL